MPYRSHVQQELVDDKLDAREEVLRDEDNEGTSEEMSESSSDESICEPSFSELSSNVVALKRDVSCSTVGCS